MQAIPTNPTARATRENIIKFCDLATVKEQLEKYNKKAAKLGVTPPKLSIIEMFEEKNPDGEINVFCKIRIEYQTIVLQGGWSIMGTIEHGPLGYVIYGPLSESFSHLREAASIGCDHCGHNRFRKLLYIVQNVEGEIKIVGSSCLREFVGIDPSFAIFLNDVHKVIRASSVEKRIIVSLENIAKQTIIEIENVGQYVKGDTSCDVRNYFGKGGKKPQLNSSQQAIFEEVYSNLLQTANKVKGDLTYATDFEYKLANIMELEYADIDDRSVNLFIGAVGFQYGNIIRERAKNSNLAKAQNDCALVNAEPGTRVNVSGKVIQSCEVANMFGYNTTYNQMVKIAVAENVVVRFYTKKAPFASYTEGDMVSLSVRVKRIRNHAKYGITIDSNYPSLKLVK